MNKLENKDAMYCGSYEEMLKIMRHIDYGDEITEQDYKSFHYILWWYGEWDLASDRMRGLNILTKEQFLRKAGIIVDFTPYKVVPTHVFI